MKKVFVLLLITVMFIGFAFISLSAPPPQIIIRGEEELAEMREMAEADGEEIAGDWGSYLRRNGIRNRDELILFLELLDSLPIPYDTGMQFNYLIYYPAWDYQTFSINFKNEAEDRYSYTFWTNEEREEGVIEKLLGDDVNIIYESQDGRMKVYSPPSTWGRNPSRHGDFSFPMEIDGFRMSARYMPEDVSGIIQRDIYRGMEVLSFGDGIWNTRYQNGDVNGDGVVNTADALEILRFAVGLPSVIIGDERAMVAADVNGDGRIDTEDALIVLRIAVGL